MNGPMPSLFCEAVLANSKKLASGAGLRTVGTNHLLYAVMETYSVGTLLRESGFDYDALKEATRQSINQTRNDSENIPPEEVHFSSQVKTAFGHARTLSIEAIEPEHLLYGMACDENEIGYRLLDKSSRDGVEQIKATFERG